MQSLKKQYRDQRRHDKAKERNQCEQRELRGKHRREKSSGKLKS
jgi:hypothetical protein